jgi:predicted AlkP superfamily phosphohydrolase/phosphomutase
MPATPARILAIGLELGDGRLLRGWAEAGLLPNVKRLLDAGAWGWLETTAEDLHISAWPSIYTGAAPGEHGVYFTFQPAPARQGYQRFYPGIYGRPTLWKLLDAAGRRCVVFDPPYSHAEDGYRGVYIQDWGTWAHYLRTASVPADLLAKLEKACGAYPLGYEANDLGLAPLDPTDIGERIGKAVAAKAAATSWLMKSREWDFLFSVFGETHVAGHYCWTSALTGDARDRGSPMCRAYQALDQAIGTLVAAAGPETTVLVLSGDRCGPNHAGWHLLPEVLARLGYAGGGAGDGATENQSPAGKRFDPVKALRDLLPKDFRKSLARRLPTKLRDKLAQRVDTADIDWSRTRAFCLPTDLEGCIRINLKGREPQGIVEPGEAYRAALDDLTAGLLELRDPQTGEPIVRKVLRTDEAFPGERRDFLPDLIVQWQSERPILAAASPRIGLVTQQSPDPRPGTHRGPGFVIAAGPGIAPGSTLAAAHIVDIAPTLLARMGVRAPAGMAGRVWSELSGTSQEILES